MSYMNRPLNKINKSNSLRCLKYVLTRQSHTDIIVPDFTKDMRNEAAQPNVPTSQNEVPRKLAAYMASGILLTSGMYAAKAEVFRYVNYMAASADVLALAQIEINLADIPEDKNVTFKWRGKPLFVWHRPEAAVKAVRSVPLNILRDPERDEDRVKDPNFLVVLGVCTHLGCVPISHQGDYGGYYCPCHGSHFDISGRARQGPAPSNLAVPKYTITGNTMLVG
ncbi:cytochrome b-c1 complex subunit Rieske, mitochondrial-like [Anthonomus grandis grandis]|uniref:cytochrome b-c1 complex subunit Rieske, mitochondrial-like n=1 Tax=Anthonomus grandis grandis TaxID=2921223 RepID=UPI002166872F|nr:cytochrome b-c1 complex subunit Rieske, mitochondrial-like [Anthonomus grandis grandis]